MQATRNSDIAKRKERREKIGCLVVASMFITFVIGFTKVFPLYLAA